MRDGPFFVLFFEKFIFNTQIPLLLLFFLFFLFFWLNQLAS